jgi:uncharacterized protein YndB with AHSA1/START domain
MSGQFQSARRRTAGTGKESAGGKRQGGAGERQRGEAAAAATLRLSWTLRAPRERVFRAWTDPRELEKWFCPSDAMKVKVNELDLRAGGRYHLEISSPAGELFRLSGVYRQVQPPEKLVYTWRWGDWAPHEPDSLVTVEFHDRGGSTEVVLTHEALPTPQRLERHREGWGGCLDHLARHLAPAAHP